MLQTNISNLLKEIQSGELEWAYCHVTNKAVECTICGFAEEGIKLLEILLSFGIKHSRNVWLPDEGLQIISIRVAYGFRLVKKANDEK